MTSINVNFLIDEFSKSKNDPFFWGTIILAPFMILIFFYTLCDCVNNSYNKIEYSKHIDEMENNNLENSNLEQASENNNDYEEDSDDDATSIDSEYSKTSYEDEDSPTEQYSSVLFKSFSLLTKKQLLKMSGSKYKYKNKDELVVIAMYKFISKAVEHSHHLPKGIKLFVKENKHSMKQELLELYQIESNDS
jgi:hypothetical protein